jgi:hypothetical protein
VKFIPQFRRITNHIICYTLGLSSSVNLNLSMNYVLTICAMSWMYSTFVYLYICCYFSHTPDGVFHYMYNIMCCTVKLYQLLFHHVCPKCNRGMCVILSFYLRFFQYILLLWTNKYLSCTQYLFYLSKQIALTGSLDLILISLKIYYVLMITLLS